MGAIIVVISVFVLGTGLVLGLFFAVTKLPGYLLQRKLNSRLDEVTADPDEKPVDGEQLVKDKHEGLLPGFDRLAGGTVRGSALAVWIEQSGVQLSISGLLMMSLVSALVFGFIAAT